MADGAILAGGVHRLKDDQHGMAVGCVQQMLLRAELRDMVFQQMAVILVRGIGGRDTRGPVVQVDRPTLRNPEVLGPDLHRHPPARGILTGRTR